MAPSQLPSLIKKLLSMQVGLGIFGLLALVSMLGTFLPPDLGLYEHPAFIALLVLLVIHTSLCTFRQLPGLIRRRYTHLSERLYHLSVWLVHLSVLCIGITGLLAALLYTSPLVSINEGDSEQVVITQDLTVDLALENLELEHYPNGMVSDWVSTVRLSIGEESTSHIIKVNQPAIRGDLKVLQGGYQNLYAMSILMPGASKEERILLPQDTAIPLDNQGELSLALSPVLPGQLTDAALTPPEVEAGNPAPQLVDLIIMAGGKVVQRGAMFSTQALELGSTGIVITVHEIRENSVFILRYTPHLVWLWASFALLALSITGLFIGKKG